MRRLAAVVLVGVAALAGCGSGDSTDQVASASGETLPDVDLTALDSGETSSLASIAGPAVVNLWATWCAPCRAEIPAFEAVHQERGTDIRFVGVNVGEDLADAQAFVDDVGATYDQFADLDGDVATALRATAMPVTIVIDAEGSITTRHLGPLDRDGLNDAIDEALGLSPN